MGKLLPEEYLTDSEYQKIAKKLIFDNCNAEISHHICNDPTKFGVVVNAVMTADWKWDGRGNKYGYRKQRAKWAIYKIISDITKKTDRPNIQTFSELLREDHEISSLNKKNFVDDVDQKDYIEYVTNQIRNSKVLLDNEKTVLIGKFIQDKTVVELSEELEVRGESIRQTLNRAMVKIGHSLCV